MVLEHSLVASSPKKQGNKCLHSWLKKSQISSYCRHVLTFSAHLNVCQIRRQNCRRFAYMPTKLAFCLYAYKIFAVSPICRQNCRRFANILTKSRRNAIKICLDGAHRMNLEKMPSKSAYMGLLGFKAGKCHQNLP